MSGGKGQEREGSKVRNGQGTKTKYRRPNKVGGTRKQIAKNVLKMLLQNVQKVNANAYFGNDEYIVMDFLTWDYQCSTFNDNCPGNGGFSLGCAKGSPYVPFNPKCVYTEKPFMTDTPCGSRDEQMFINEDCTNGFLCMDNLPQGETGGGCLVECAEEYKIFPEFLTILAGTSSFTVSTKTSCLAAWENSMSIARMTRWIPLRKSVNVPGKSWSLPTAILQPNASSRMAIT